MSREYPPRPIVGIGVVVWRDGQVLLIRRGKEPGLGNWSLPGGAQKVGETIAEGARREVLEETGLEIDVLGLIDVVDSIRRDVRDAVQYHYTLVDMVADWRSGEAVAQGDAAGVTWADPAGLQAYRLWSETERIIRLAAERRAVLAAS